MADYYESLQSPNNNYKNPTSSFLNFISKSSSAETESSIMSPTSILDFKVFKHTPKQEIKNHWPSQGLSLGLVEALTDDTAGPNSTRSVLFGSQLRIQVPPLHPSDFGIKSHVGPFSPSNLRKHVNSGPVTNEMELSEDYTCVISYGPNPKTTHIFDDCIVESCCGVVKFSESRKDDSFVNRSMSFYPSDSFLSRCCNCKKNLEQGCDIYMYRGEKAFCSVECRFKEMTMEEEEWFGTSEPNQV